MTHEREQALLSHYNSRVRYKTPLRRPRFMQQLARAAPLGPGARVLDVGCGTGVLVRLLRNHLRDFTYVGVDYSETRIARARELFAGKGVTFTCADINTFVCAGGGVHDVVFAVEVLEHLEHPRDVVESLLQHNVAPGGRIVGSVPHRLRRREHLQFYKSEEDAKIRLGFDGYSRFERFLICWWDGAG